MKINLHSSNNGEEDHSIKIPLDSKVLKQSNSYKKIPNAIYRNAR